MALETFCPATMCPLFAAEGSPWTGERNSHCDGGDCAWFQGGKCEGSRGAREQVHELEDGGRVLQIGIKRHADRVAKPTTFDCPRAAECQWQREASPGELCPPRFALSKGLDPKACAY